MAVEGIVPESMPKEFTARDGTRIFYREWQGARESDIILYLHGIESHTGWFINTGNLLNREGFHIYAADRRGSGRNKTDRGHMESYRVLVDDVKEIVDFIRRKHPRRKVYLMGLCWGAKIAVTFAACYQNLIDGLILWSPAIKTRVGLPLGQKIDIAFSNILRPRKLFSVPLEDRVFTRNPEYLEFIKNDGMRLKKVTARFFLETEKMNRALDKIAGRISVPVLALLAGDDAIVDNEGVRKWLAGLGSKDKITRVYPGCCHSLEFEKSIDDIVSYIADWMRKR